MLPETMADLIEADRGYVRALFSCWLEPARVSRDVVRDADTRPHRPHEYRGAGATDMLEPERHHVGFGTAGATGILTSLRRFADGALALEAYLEDGAPDTPPETRPFADQLDATMAEKAGTICPRASTPSDLPPLRATQQALAAEAGPAAPLTEETDRMVNSLAITAHVLERGDGTTASEPSTGRVRPSSAAAAELESAEPRPERSLECCHSAWSRVRMSTPWRSAKSRQARNRRRAKSSPGRRSGT